MSDDVRRALEDAGRRAAPDPDPAFGDALEARLLAVRASLPPEGSPPPRDGRGRRRWGLATGAAAIVAAVAVIAILVTGPMVPRQLPVDAPELAAPVNVEVALVDGTVLEDPDGLLLPEGAVVRVGEGGYARIGDTELGPGDVATIRDGRLEIEHASPVAVGPTSTPGRTPRPDATGRDPTPRPRPSRTPDATPRRTPAPTRTPAATPAPDRTPAPTAPPTPAPTRAPGTEPPPVDASPTPTPQPPVRRPRLRARLVAEHRIAVRWTETFRARRYVLVATTSRSGAAPDPVYPGSRVLGEFATPPEVRLRYRVPLGVTEVRLQVVALRGDGSVLRRSRIVAIPIPAGDATGDPTTSPVPGASPAPSAPGPTPTPSATPSAAP
jgi:hypothetical protein